MLATALLAPVVSAAIATAGVAASARARRRLARDVLAWRAAIAMCLFATAVAAGWVPLAVVTASGAVLASLAMWTIGPIRRRWGHPLPRGPKWDWERFDAAFRAHVDRVERRQRPPRPSDG